MKRTHRPASPRAFRLISLALCYSLIITTVFLPLTPGVIAEGSNSEVSSPSIVIVPSAGLFRAAGRVLASMITFLQGGGLPSVPGSNLPDLDTARAIQPSDPVAPAPANAANMAIYGMRNGSFTGMRLDRYINNTLNDFVGARAVINGRRNNEANRIARRAQVYLNAITAYCRP